MSSATSIEDLQKTYEQAGQGHVFEHFQDLKTYEQASLLEQLRSIKVAELANLYKAATTTTTTTQTTTSSSSSSSSDNDKDDNNKIQPFSGDIGRSSDDALTKECQALGLQAIRDGKVASLVLAGGQGTRLGYSGPKGMYKIAVGSSGSSQQQQQQQKKSLFQLLVERLIKLGQLASASADDTNNNNNKSCRIPFYIMTSPLNHTATKEFFEQNDYFGARSDDIFFFQQGMLPCLSLDDGPPKILMESRSKVAMAPDGNGGIYPSLQASGALDDMVHNRGVQYLNVFSIDNALTKPADPAFLGYCIRQQADCGNKSVWKAHAHEKVGVVAARGGNKKPCIVEYSEITTEMAEQTDAQGRLVFGAGNICNHFFTVDFLKNEIIPNMRNLYHVAKKKIPVYDKEQSKTVTPTTTNNGIKLEAFIFDVFPMSKNMAVWEVERAEEFAPVKNATGADSPETAQSMMSNLAQAWLQAAGAKLVFVDNEPAAAANGGEDNDEKHSNSTTTTPTPLLCEVSPLTSYAGEGLESYKDKTLKVPFSI